MQEFDLDDMARRMQKSQSKDQIDERAQEFLKHYGGAMSSSMAFSQSGKGGRKRMAKILYDVPRSQMALIPFYARFTAIVSQYFRDLGQDLVQQLESEFNRLYEDSDVVKIESKIRNIRFLGELTKFGVCPAQIVLECLKKCLDDFHPHNIEILIHLLETCGKYLARAGEEPALLKFSNLLDILARLKESKD